VTDKLDYHVKQTVGPLALVGDMHTPGSSTKSIPDGMGRGLVPLRQALGINRRLLRDP